MLSTARGEADTRWFGIRCIFHHAALETYEERITLWQAKNFDEAVERAEREAIEYAADLVDVHYLGLAQAFHVYDEPGDGSEVFSLMRDSALESEAYVSHFFDTGHERERKG